MFTRILATAVAASLSNAALITEYSAYSSAKNGGTQVYVSAAVHGELESVASLPVLFYTERGTTNVHGRADATIPLYFDTTVYAVDPGDETLPEFISFLDFAQPGEAGVYAGGGQIGAGHPPPSVAHDLLAEATCDSPPELCTFTDTDGNPFSVSLSHAVHAVTEADAGQTVSIKLQGGVIDLSATDYNDYVVSRQTRVSLEKQRLALWTDGETIKLFNQPDLASQLGDLVTMITMIVATVVIIEVSKSTTYTMRYRLVSNRDYSDTTVYVLADVASTACFLIAVKLYHGRSVFEEQPFDPSDMARTAFDYAALTACAASGFATLYQAWIKKQKMTIQHEHELWVWCRTSYEVAVIICACSAAPLMVGRRFVYLLRYACGFVVCVVVGRDARHVARTLPWHTTTLVVIHSALAIVCAAHDMFLPVVYTSRSFRETHMFGEFLALGIAINCVSIGAGVFSPPAKTQPPAQSNVAASSQTTDDTLYERSYL